MKLVILLSRIPYPLEKGDKLRAYHQIKNLSAQHEVYLFCLTDQSYSENDVEHLKQFCSSVNIYPLARLGILLRLFKGLFSSKPFQVYYFFSKKIKRKMYKEIGEIQPDHIFCQLIRTTEYVKHLHNYPKTLDYMDALSTGMERIASERKGFWKWFYNTESKRLTAYENLIFEYFEHHVIISEQDRKLIYHERQDEIAVIPNGVDTAFFKPGNYAKQFDIVFIGNLSYAPNIATAKYIVQTIVPLLAEKKPGISVLICGADPDRQVLDLASNQVKVKGWVEDIREAYGSGKIFLAPTRINTGMQNKLLEAMAMGVPCITSPMANNAIGAEHEQSILVCETAEDYAETVLQLLENEDQYQRIAQNALEFVESTYSWKESTTQLAKLFSQA